ncbi:CDK inhibitor Rum1 [Schizosaccharomyces japonicus yFS275]|uniref:CDK inhibitor Rum1 n=1 Tax=Schizosaccharomyces japonicus (strain yFS275 / FY16936) TaxID=402676 RepID=B6K021_SCHJY|nr:CDK inhibitor Rum1 [Schizosaccharomyces japonicus yFS275]EEB06171.2 CDK inhibitor Rum1 [Schizosaccharomyces japonicus yFS275]
MEPQTPPAPNRCVAASSPSSPLYGRLDLLPVLQESSHRPEDTFARKKKGHAAQIFPLTPAKTPKKRLFSERSVFNDANGFCKRRTEPPSASLSTLSEPLLKEDAANNPFLDSRPATAPRTKRRCSPEPCLPDEIVYVFRGKKVKKSVPRDMNLRSMKPRLLFRSRTLPSLSPENNPHPSNNPIHSFANERSPTNVPPSTPSRHRVPGSATSPSHIYRSALNHSPPQQKQQLRPPRPPSFLPSVDCSLVGVLQPESWENACGSLSTNNSSTNLFSSSYGGNENADTSSSPVHSHTHIGGHSNNSPPSSSSRNFRNHLPR